jgi:hypothetical protein
MSEIIYEGNVCVYLQGKGALLPHGRLDQKNISYFLGSRRSSILLKDFRHKPIHAARHILSGKNGIEFADIFNEPAWVQVYTNLDKNELEIELHESKTAKGGNTLWLGVLDDNEMSVQEAEWEVLRPISKKRTAFAVLVKEQ